MSRQTRISKILTQEYSPIYLEIEDESKHHHVPKGAESHFKITVVSSIFSDLNRVARHRLINKLLQDELNQGLHALSLHLFTPNEWIVKQGNVMASPKCKNGFEK